MNDSVSLQSVINLLNNNKINELYDLHLKYRLTPIEAREVINYLGQMGIIETDGNTFIISDSISNTALRKLYKEMRYRSLKLDFDEISSFEEKALPLDTLYCPNFDILDEALIV